MSMGKEREYNYTFGVLSAFAIIFVVVGHLHYDVFTLDGLFPYYSYHMMLFMFISGYFYKQEHEKHIGLFLLKKVKRLVIPYFVWNVFYGILVTVLKQFGFTIGSKMNYWTLLVQPFINGHQFYFNLAAWFLLALFIIEVVYLLIRKIVRLIIKNDYVALPILFAIFMVMGLMITKFSMEGNNHSWNLILIRTLFFLPFYCFGNMYKEILEKWDKINNYLYFAIILAMQFVLIMYYGKVPTCSTVFGIFYHNPISHYLTAFIGIAFWYRVARIIAPVVKKDGWLIYLGKNSFTVMMHHLAILYGYMMVMVFISRHSGLFADIDVNVIKTTQGAWYLPNGNYHFYLVYLVLVIVTCIVMCKLRDKVKNMWKERFSLYTKNKI